MSVWHLTHPATCDFYRLVKCMMHLIHDHDTSNIYLCMYPPYLNTSNALVIFCIEHACTMLSAMYTRSVLLMIDCTRQH